MHHLDHETMESLFAGIRVDPAVPPDMVLVIGSTPSYARREGSFLDQALKAMERGDLVVVRNIGRALPEGPTQE